MITTINEFKKIFENNLIITNDFFKSLTYTKKKYNILLDSNIPYHYKKYVIPENNFIVPDEAENITVKTITPSGLSRSIFSIKYDIKDKNIELVIIDGNSINDKWTKCEIELIVNGQRILHGHSLTTGIIFGRSNKYFNSKNEKIDEETYDEIYSLYNKYSKTFIDYYLQKYFNQ